MLSLDDCKYYDPFEDMVGASVWEVGAELPD